MSAATRERVLEQITRMQAATARQVDAYQRFSALAQQGRFKEAGACMVEASAAFESAMDSFLCACQLERGVGQ